MCGLIALFGFLKNGIFPSFHKNLHWVCVLVFILGSYLWAMYTYACAVEHRAVLRWSNKQRAMKKELKGYWYLSSFIEFIIVQLQWGFFSFIPFAHDLRSSRLTYPLILMP